MASSLWAVVFGEEIKDIGQWDPARMSRVIEDVGGFSVCLPENPYEVEWPGTGLAIVPAVEIKPDPGHGETLDGYADVLEGQEVRRVWNLRAKTEEELAADIERETAMLKRLRSLVLRNTDFAALPDCPLDESLKAKVLAARQQVRDMSKEEGYPFKYTWPDAVIPQLSPNYAL